MICNGYLAYASQKDKHSSSFQSMQYMEFYDAAKGLCQLRVSTAVTAMLEGAH
jgi:hypothetical protein